MTQATTRIGTPGGHGAALECDARRLVIRWADGRASPFHHLWLRDNCACAACLHPQTRERLLDSAAIDPDVVPQRVTIDGDELVVVWQGDGHVTRLGLDWLRAHAYDSASRAERRRAPLLWGRELAEHLPEADCAALLADDATLLAWLIALRDRGVAFLRAIPDVDAGRRAVERISFRRETNFGLDWDVMAKADPNNVAYTAVELKAHTDLANWELPPGIQFLHCLESTARGGENLLVDGFNVAEQLRRDDPAAFGLLSRVAVPFRFHDAAWDLRHSAPTIELDAEGGLHAIRYHNALTAPLDLPEDLVEPFYGAYRAFTAVLRRSENELVYRLGAGDMVAFDNRRVLHGRRAFEATSGRRHYKGCYVDLDQIRSRIRVLERGTG